MIVNIRKAEHRDSEGIIETLSRSISEVCAADYTPAEISAWSGKKTRKEIWNRIIDRDSVWIIECDSKVKGYIHFALMDKTQAEIHGLYLTPELCGLGYGKKLLQLTLIHATTNGIKTISLDSTRTAKKFYETLGFIQYKGDASIEMQGIQIPCHPMRLFL